MVGCHLFRLPGGQRRIDDDCLGSQIARGMACQDKAWSGNVGRGSVWLGAVRLGAARLGNVRQG